MKIHLISKKTIEDYAVGQANSRSALETWLDVVKYADWEKPEDITATFNSADILGNNSKRVVFDIGGNNYRMICKYSFGQKAVRLFVKWIGTHAEYDKLCKRGQQYLISDF